MRRLFKEVGNRAYRISRLSGNRPGVSDDIRSDYTTPLLFASSGLRSLSPRASDGLEKYWEKRWLVKGLVMYFVITLTIALMPTPWSASFDMVTGVFSSVVLGVAAGSGLLFMPDRESVSLLYKSVRDLQNTQDDSDYSPARVAVHGAFMDSYVSVMTRKSGARRAMRKGLMRDSADVLQNVSCREWGVLLLECDAYTLEMMLNLATPNTSVGELMEAVELLRGPTGD
jgi:hypothetical protein